MVEKSMVGESLFAVQDYLQHLHKYIGRLDYDLDVLVNDKSVQACPEDVGKIAQLRLALRESLKHLDELETATDRFKEAFDV